MLDIYGIPNCDIIRAAVRWLDDHDKAVLLMCDHPSMIRRPVLVSGDVIEVGFSAQRYEALLV